MCANDPNCTAFHFYLLDPGHYNNCWIWTASGYFPNGSHRAYCYVKDADFVPDEADLEEEWETGWDSHIAEKWDEHYGEYFESDGHGYQYHGDNLSET